MEGSVKSVFLHCTAGGSDKVYNMTINYVHGTYELVVEYGKRGSVLKEITKSTNRTMYEANRDWDELYTAKVQKGYKIVNQAKDGTLVPLPKKAKTKPADAEEPKHRKITFDL